MHPTRLFLHLTLFLFLFLSNCIERNNPFDPRSYSPEPHLDSISIDIIRDSASLYIDSVRQIADPYAPKIDSLSLLYSADMENIDSISSTNDSIMVSNDSLRRYNASVESYNDSISIIDSLRFKKQLDTLFYISIQTDTLYLHQLHERIQLLRAITASFVDSINAAFAPDTIYTPSRRNSILVPYESLLSQIITWIDRIDSLSQWIDTSNSRQISPYNQSVGSENSQIFLYNEHIAYLKQHQQYETITSVDSLEDKFFHAGPGSVILMDSGTYSPFLRTNSSGTERDPIVIQGQPDMSTIFSASEILFSNNNHFVLRNIVFRDSDLDAIKLEDGSGPIVFDNCIFVDNNANGLNIIDSDVRITNCRITNNKGRGVFTSSDQKNNNYVHIHNTLIAHNDFAGVEIIAATNLFVTNSTISDNQSQGLTLRGSGITLQINNSIISYNKDGIMYDFPFSAEHLFTLGATVIYGNRDLAIRGTGGEQPRYIDEIDPLFVDRENNNYALLPSSELVKLENMGVSIGYRQ